MYLMWFLIFASKDSFQSRVKSYPGHFLPPQSVSRTTCLSRIQPRELEMVDWAILVGLPDIQEPINDISIIPGLHVVSYVLVSRINEISLLVHNV